MADVLIAAIARTCDEAELERVLSQCVGMEKSRLTLFIKSHRREAPARSRIHFIPLAGSSMASGTHGTNVPGMASTLALSPYFADAHSDHLKTIGISNDAAQYYGIAIDEGRSVVTYAANAESAALVEAQFRSCGFVKVRRFPVREIVCESVTS